LIDDRNRCEVDAVINDVKLELRSLFGKSKEQIKKVGNAFKRSGFKEESLCELIKNALKEEITEGLISSRSIELYCPPEWKRKTKPKNEKTSFSKQVEEKPQQQIAVTHAGKSVVMNETSSNTEKYPFYYLTSCSNVACVISIQDSLKHPINSRNITKKRGRKPTLSV
jgi:hypothetical protein